MSEVPMCGYEGCSNIADPRYFAYCKHGKLERVCEAHILELGAEGAPVEHPWLPYRQPCSCSQEPQEVPLGQNEKREGKEVLPEAILDLLVELKQEMRKAEITSMDLEMDEGDLRVRYVRFIRIEVAGEEEV